MREKDGKRMNESEKDGEREREVGIRRAFFLMTRKKERLVWKWRLGKVKKERNIDRVKESMEKELRGRERGEERKKNGVGAKTTEKKTRK